ncbi:hypothetical protein M8J77_024585 [Diaphorina citri]|nr:hypothetical protein M8J77_024585 [Diaphorina citri]
MHTSETRFVKPVHQVNTEQCTPVKPSFILKLHLVTSCSTQHINLTQPERDREKPAQDFPDGQPSGPQRHLAWHNFSDQSRTNAFSQGANAARS